MRWGPAGPPPLVVKIAPDLTQEDKQVRAVRGGKGAGTAGCARGEAMYSM